MKLKISALSNIPIANLSSLPVASGIYLALDDANRVWYVGKAKSLRNRLNQHEKLDLLKQKATKIAWIPFPFNQTDTVEKSTIQNFNPPFNKQLKRGKSSCLPNVSGQSPEQILEKYRTLKEQEKALKEEIEDIKPDVVTAIEQLVQDEVQQEVQYDRCIFKINTRPQYCYTSEVEKLNKELISLRKQEINNGKAQVISRTCYPSMRRLDR